jgi:hypothetical protein
LYNDVKLPYARDRIVEPYFYACGIFHEEENSHVRIIFTKVFVLLGLMDDTYDVHATLEECQMLNEAMQRYICIYSLHQVLANTVVFCMSPH